MAASGRPRGYSSLDSRRKRAYPSLSPLEVEGEADYRSPTPERKARSWGGGGRGAPWSVRDIDDWEGARSSPSQEEEDDYDDGGTWGAPGRGRREPSWESVSPKREGSRGSWEPPPKRARSPPVEGRWRDPLHPSRGKGWTSPESQGQPSVHSGHATHRNRSSRRDPAAAAGYGGGSPRSWEDLGLETGKDYLLEDRSYPAKAGEGGGSGERRRGRSTQNVPHGRRELDPTGPSRDHRGRQEWIEDPEEAGSFSSQSQFSLKERRGRPARREDDGWAGDDGFENLRSAKGDLDDWDDLTDPLSWDPKEGQGSAEGGFGGPKYRPKANEESGKPGILPVGWVPRKEVLDFWRRCQTVMRKSVREYLLSTCPRPAMPDRSTETPELNASIMSLLSEKQVRNVSLATRNLYMAQDELLNMLAPAMTIYEMAEEAIEKGEALDPLELREWVRRVIRYIGSINQRLTHLRRSQVLGAINPRLKTMTKLVGPKSGGLLFAPNQVKFLKEIIRKFPEFSNESEKEIRNQNAKMRVKKDMAHVR